MELIIVPTAHVSKQSITKVRETILREKPNLVAVELCASRFRSLMHGERPSIMQMLNTPLYSTLFLIQQALGVLFGSKPGAEMKEAILAASEAKIPILLADVDINITMRRAAKIPLREKLGIILQIFTSPFSGGLKRASLDDLTTPNFLAPILSKFQTEFPVTYSALVEQRNRHIFSSLLNFPDKKIVLVVGAGHAAGIAELARSNTALTTPPINCVII